MGFPLVCYCIAVPKPVLVLFKLLNAIKLTILLALYAVGLHRFPYTHQHDHSQLYNHRRSAAAEVTLPSAVKEQLPAVEFAQFSPPQKKRLACHEDEEPTCMFCLENLEAKDEARRLGNCSHAFHRDCIDQWIDLGQVTCPLCRSPLLPHKRRGLRGCWGRLANLRTRIW